MAMSKLLAKAIKASTKSSGKPQYGKMKANLSKKVREGAASAEESKALKELRSMDAKAFNRARIKASETLRSKKPVTLAGMKVKEKGTKVSFYDSKTGEVFEMSKKKYDEMTPNQRIKALENMKARSRLGEDLSDKGMAKQRKKLAAARASRKAYGGKTVKKQMGGKLNSKPKGVGCATRGYGKAMK